MSESDSKASDTHAAGTTVAVRINGGASAEEVAAVTAALSIALASGDAPAHEHQSGWVVAARLEAQGHPQISTLRHIAAHSATH